MTGRAKRVTLIVGVTALVAVIAGATLAPALLAAPKRDKDAGDFTIEVTYDWGQGGFTAAGAIDDVGPAYFVDYGPILAGTLGTICIDLENSQRFTICEGTGAYEHLTGAGKYTVKITVYMPKKKLVDEPVYRVVYQSRGSTS
jgi:hypothetical protein